MRTCPRDDEQGMVAAKTLDNLGFKKIAILHDNTSYAKGLADEAKALLKSQGKEIVFFDALTPGERDYNAILTKLKASVPDVLFFHRLLSRGRHDPPSEDGHGLECAHAWRGCHE